MNVKELECAWKNLFITYLNLSYHINTFDKNYKCLEELIKITYDSYKFILTYSISFMKKLIKKNLKQFIRKPKNL